MMQALRAHRATVVRLVLIAAALSSLATSAPTWRLSVYGNPPEETILLDASAPMQVRNFTVQAISPGDSVPSLDMNIRFALDYSFRERELSVRVALLEYGEDGTSRVMTELVYTLSGSSSFVMDMPDSTSLFCEDDMCTGRFGVSVTIEGDVTNAPNTELEVPWAVFATLIGEGDSEPPVGARIDIIFE